MAKGEDNGIWVGPAGWAYEDWKGIVYPPSMPRGEHPLSIIAALFDMVEVNSTFYHPPRAAHCAGWLRQAEGNPRFLFTVKLWERFTHKRHAWPSDEEIAQYTQGIAPLAEAGKLGAILVQFPWSFKRTRENRIWLGRIADAFAGRPLALEIRHASWDQPEVYRGLLDRGIAFCNIDQPLFSHSVAPSEEVTAPTGYIRMHGRNYDDWFRDDAGRDDRYNYLYSEEELKPWIEKAQRMKRKVNGLFIVTNNHYRGQAVVNALEIQAALGKTSPSLPPHLVQHYPRLKKLLLKEDRP